MTPEQERAIALARARAAAEADTTPAAAPQTATPSAPPGMTRGPTGKLAPTMTFNSDTGPMQAADDIVRLIANGASFGYADKLAGAMNGTGKDAERALSAEAGNRAGLAGKVAEIGGAAALPIGMGKAGLSLVGGLGSGALKGATGLAARTGLAATEGAGYGALGASGHDTNISDGALLGAVFGAGGNLAAEGVTNAASAIAGGGRAAAPTIDAGRQAADAAYGRAENAGVIFTPTAVDRLKQNVTGYLADFGFDPTLHPGAAAVLRRLDDLQGQNVTLRGLDTLRKVASNGFVPGNASNNRIVNEIVDQLDGVVGNPAAGEVLTGNAQDGAAALQEARGLWSRLSKHDRVTRADDMAGLRAASTGKGGNVDNATRQNMRRILEKPRGYTADEQGALRTAVQGTPVQNALRTAGSFAPTGAVSMGSGAAVGAGAAHAVGLDPMIGAIAIPAISQGAKWLADAGTNRNVQELIDTIMRGGQRAPLTPAQNAILGSRDALARGVVGAAANAITKPNDEIKRAVMRSAGRQ